MVICRHRVLQMLYDSSNDILGNGGEQGQNSASLPQKVDEHWEEYQTKVHQIHRSNHCNDSGENLLHHLLVVDIL